MIPKILHQTSPTRDFTARQQRWRASWRQHNLDLEICHCDDAQSRAFVAAEFPEHLAIYDAFPYGVMRADLFRYLAVYRYGGLYADIDMECVRNFDRFFAMDGALFSIEAQRTRAKQKTLGYAKPYQIANCIFAAEAGHPFLKAIIQRIAALANGTLPPDGDAVLDVTGPHMLTRLYYERPFPGLRLLSQTYWMPSRSYPCLWPFSANVYAMHHFEGSWKSKQPVQPRSFASKWEARDILPNPLARMFFSKNEP